jgi:predicted DCC family thiol-disulfide oxidoreductase YuxK
MSQFHLPTPQDHPSADVVIFDGECSFCRGQVERLNRWDGAGRLTFLSLHDPAVSRYVNLTHDELMQQMYIVDQRGGVWGGAAALRYLSRRLPRLWPLAPLLHIPFSMPFWGWLYAQVASRRYRLNRESCDGHKCHVHVR